MSNDIEQGLLAMEAGQGGTGSARVQEQLQDNRGRCLFYCAIFSAWVATLGFISLVSYGVSLQAIDVKTQTSVSSEGVLMDRNGNHPIFHASSLMQSQATLTGPTEAVFTINQQVVMAMGAFHQTINATNGTNGTARRLQASDLIPVKLPALSLKHPRASNRVVVHLVGYVSRRRRLAIPPQPVPNTGGPNQKPQLTWVSLTNIQRTLVAAKLHLLAAAHRLLDASQGLTTPIGNVPYAEVGTICSNAIKFGWQRFGARVQAHFVDVTILRMEFRTAINQPWKALLLRADCPPTTSTVKKYYNMIFASLGKQYTVQCAPFICNVTVQYSVAYLHTKLSELNDQKRYPPTLQDLQLWGVQLYQSPSGLGNSTLGAADSILNLPNLCGGAVCVKPILKPVVYFDFALSVTDVINPSVTTSNVYTVTAVTSLLATTKTTLTTRAGVTVKNGVLLFSPQQKPYGAYGSASTTVIPILTSNKPFTIVIQFSFAFNQLPTQTMMLMHQLNINYWTVTLDKSTISVGTPTVRCSITLGQNTWKLTSTYYFVFSYSVSPNLSCMFFEHAAGVLHPAKPYTNNKAHAVNFPASAWYFSYPGQEFIGGIHELIAYDTAMTITEVENLISVNSQACRQSVALQTGIQPSCQALALLVSTLAVYDTITNSQCYPSSTEVYLADGTKTQISNVFVGDEVLAFDPRTGRVGVTEIYMNGHREFDFQEYWTIGTGSTKVSVSEDHFVPIIHEADVFSCVMDGKPAKSRLVASSIDFSDTYRIWRRCVTMERGKNVAEGDWVLTWRGALGMQIEQVLSVRKELRWGLFNPYTKWGTIIVNDVVGSVHSEWILDTLVPKAVHAYLPAINQALFFPARVMYDLVPQCLKTLDDKYPRGLYDVAVYDAVSSIVSCSLLKIA